VSRGDLSCTVPGCGNLDEDISFDASSTGGTVVVFSTEERLGGEDEDSVEDVYLRDLGEGTTTLVSVAAESCSAPSCGNGAEPAFFDGASADALTVAFGSGEPLSDEDEDAQDDIYLRDVQAQTTSLVSAAGVCPGIGTGECTPIYRDISDDGSHVFFETGERVAAGQDTDQRQDVYDFSGVAPVLISVGSAGGNGAEHAIYAGTTADGSTAFFETAEGLEPGDGDNAGDVYSGSGGSTALISTGPADAGTGVSASFEKSSPTGATVVFRTTERLTIEDEDSNRDIYLRDIGTSSTTLLSVAGASCLGSCGTGADASFAGASSDNSHVFFETDEPLVGGDTDSSPDVYERAGGQTMLVSTSASSHNAASTPHLEDVSEDADHALFTTDERLASGDVDAETDVYDRSGNETQLVSTRNPDELVLGPAVPALTATTPPSPNPSTEPRVLGEADLGTSIKIYTTADCSGAPVATGSSTELEGSGIAVKVAASSTSSFHATATLVNDTSACSIAGLTYQQVPETGAGGGGGSGGEGSGGSGSTGSPSGGRQPVGGGGRDSAGAHLTPQTRITFAPASKTRQRRPTFQFFDSTGQEGTRFVCAVDRGGWRSCSSPIRLKKLGRGKHVFKVKGVNSGLWESNAVSRTFKVVNG
jgi:hypothetical protein